MPDSAGDAEPFHGILFPDTGGGTSREGACEPDFFGDLNLDQIVAAITAGKTEYDLKPFFYLPLSDADDVVFRQEIMRDLENHRLSGDIMAFAVSMRETRDYLARFEKFRHRLQKERWFLDAVETYCHAVVRLSADLSRAALGSRGLSGFRDDLARYVASARFTTLVSRTKRLTAGLATIHYTILIDGGHVRVRRYAGERDYGAEVEATFERFKQGDVEKYAFGFGDSDETNHVEAAILDQVAKLYPEIFTELENYVAERRDFIEPAIAGFDREIQFYIAYLDYLAPFKKAGLSFCYPRVGRASKEVYDYQGFDLALAGKLITEKAVPVRNDFHLEGRERIIVVSGPNQGGKTTFARCFGQLHYLACLGCPVPGTRARLFLFDRLFTHFEREEEIANLRGKLEDDLIRLRDILDRATPNSILIMNEVFTSTTVRDARVLSEKIAARIMRLDLLSLWVTFLDELASLSDQTVSMVSTVVPENPAQRTYKIVRRPADGLAYALSIAEKYRLTSAMLGERLDS